MKNAKLLKWIFYSLWLFFALLFFVLWFSETEYGLNVLPYWLEITIIILCFVSACLWIYFDRKYQKMKRLHRRIGYLIEILPVWFKLEYARGLCSACNRLEERVIGQKGATEIIKFMYKYEPKHDSILYWWPAGEVEPRIEFLKQLQKKLE